MDDFISTNSDEYDLEELKEYIQANLEDELVKKALESGVDLREYCKNIESQLHDLETASIQDYIKESENIVMLHKEISVCDDILEAMEKTLVGFQNNLNSISSEIQTLQRQSVSMNRELMNRQEVKGHLDQIVDDLNVPDSMIKCILEKPVTDQEFLEQLHELSHKINFVSSQNIAETKACHDVKDILDKLKHKALERIREFFLQKIYQLRKPMTNYQIPQNALLNHRFFNEFLMTHEKNVACEIQTEYVDTMMKIYYSYFKAYLSKVMKLQYDESPDKDDLMGVEDSARKSLFSTKSSLKNRSTVFTLGARGNILTTELEAPIIVPHAAQKVEQKYPYELLFRSVHYALVDNCCREFLFISDFFNIQNHAALEVFNAIFAKTLQLYAKMTDEFVNNCFDSIALFLCAQLAHRYKVLIHKRSAPVLDKYWDTLLDLLYTRFNCILQMNTHSIVNCDVQKLEHIDLSPHYITRRYAEFAAAIIALNENFPNEEVSARMATLQKEVVGLVSRMASEFGKPRQPLVFMINNYDMMLNIILERTRDECKECENFMELLALRTNEYSEDILEEHFSELLSFIRRAETARDDAGLRIDEKKLANMIRSFNNNWKKLIDLMNQEIMKSFANFKNGTQILQTTLTQLISFHHRLIKVFTQKPYSTLAIKSELLNIHNIMVEVKKYKPVF